MKKLILILLIIIGTTKTFAQVDNYRADLDYLFGALDKTKVYTGYLAPYGIDAVDKDDFNGLLTDSNMVNNLDLFRFIYADIYTAKFNPTAISLPSVNELNSELTTQNPTSLALLYAKYNEFKEDGVQQGYFRYTDGKLYDNEVQQSRLYNPANGYETKNLLYWRRYAGQVKQPSVSVPKFKPTPNWPLLAQICRAGKVAKRICA